VDVPWDVLWLVGGGFALAKAIEDTGLSRVRSLHTLIHIPLLLSLSLSLPSVLFGVVVLSNDQFFADGLNEGLGNQDKVLVLWIFVLVISM
jgi:di/tricarboxylate transporter